MNEPRRVTKSDTLDFYCPSCNNTFTKTVRRGGYVHCPRCGVTVARVIQYDDNKFEAMPYLELKFVDL